MRRALLLATLLLSGCAGSPLQTVDAPADVGADEVVLVGKIELVPPLLKSELPLYGGATTATLVLDDRPRRFDGRLSASDLSGRLESPLGSVFMLRRQRAPFFIRVGYFLNMEHKRAYLPGGFEVQVRPDDRAVYIGTIRYRRDEFLNILSVSVEDEHKATEARFKEKFGARRSLRKVLARAVDPER